MSNLLVIDFLDKRELRSLNVITEIHDSLDEAQEVRLVHKARAAFIKLPYLVLDGFPRHTVLENDTIEGDGSVLPKELHGIANLQSGGILVKVTGAFTGNGMFDGHVFILPSQVCRHTASRLPLYPLLLRQHS